jgi:asparagine synthetase B (glutamine-hydrolysing)
MLDGDFSLILYDKNKQEIYCARDPYGTNKLFVVPNIKTPETSWEITNHADFIDPIQIGTYCIFKQDTSNIWRFHKANGWYHTVPPSTRSVIQNLWLASFHYIQYLKWKVCI